MAESNDKDAQETIVAFLDLASFEEGAAFRGGCLVTDASTQPIEFRVSGTVRPTKLQKMLYGDTLHGYICSDLVGLPIIETLEAKPAVVMVRDAAFLSLRPRIGIPMLCILSPVEGEPMFQAHPEYEQEADENSNTLPNVLRERNLMEPFSRVHNGLAEAHNLKIGES